MKAFMSAGAAFALLLGLPLAAHAADGEQIYTDTCAACHGETGAGDRDMKAPAIAGQHDWYLLRQLNQFREGPRGRDMDRDETGASMRAIAEFLDPTDLADIAAYVAALRRPASGAWQGGNLAVGRGFYEICAACHGVRGDGNAAFQAPALAGQDGQYLYDQLVKFKNGVRGGPEDDPLAQQMKSMAEVLSDDNTVQSVVAYIVTLP